MATESKITPKPRELLQQQRLLQYVVCSIERIVTKVMITPMWELAPENGLLQKQRLRRP